MKKIFALSLLFILSVVLVGCVKDTTTLPTTAETTTTGNSDQASVDAVYDWLNPGTLTGLTNTSERLILPTIREGVSISWEISHPERIAVNGVISQPEHGTGDVTVTLTATITLNACTRTREFTATVLELTSPEDAEPVLNETFSSYADGNIVSQVGGSWAPVSGKTGTSRFYVVSSISGTTIPAGAKALQVNAFTELQVEAAIVHSLDLIVIEADVYQTANGSPIYLQTSSSSPVIGFGVYGGESGSARLYYRTDNGEQFQTSVALNTWHKIRLEVNLTNKTIEFFYYDSEGHLVSCTPGPVPYTGSTSMNRIYLRSGSSTTTTLNEHPSYITNIVANRIEALPRPVDPIKIGTVSGIESPVTVQNGTEFTPAVPIVNGLYGSHALLVKDTDYSLVVNNPVNTAVDGDYTVTYTITNLSDPLDVVVRSQTVTVFNPNQPNTISGATSTIAGALTHLTNVTVYILRPEGTLHYVLSATPLSASEILASGAKVSLTVTNTTVVLNNIEVPAGQNLYFVVELNGTSNVLEHTVYYQTTVLITTPQQFYDALHLSQSNQTDKYFLLANDLDFTGFSWTAVANTFYATLDGDGNRISNLTINKVGIKGGIITKLDGGTIRRLVLDHVTTFSDTSGSGLLVGELYGTTLIEDIVVMNSSNVVQIDLSLIVPPDTPSSYGAIIAGRIRTGSTIIRNISIIDTTVESKHNYGGGLVAGMEASTSAVFQDIYLKNFVVKEATDTVASTGKMVGGIIGRIRGNVTIERVVALNITVIGMTSVGGLIGKCDTGGVTTINDIYLTGTITALTTETLLVNVLAGNLTTTATVENAYASGFVFVDNSGLEVAEDHIIDSELVQVESWWTTNIPTILSSPLWSFGGTMPILDNLYSNQIE